MAEAPGEESFAAANVEGVIGIVRDRRQNLRVIVDVVIPGLDHPGRHQTTLITPPPKPWPFEVHCAWYPTKTLPTAKAPRACG